MDNKKNIIFVLPEELDEEKIEYSDAVSWGHSNYLHNNVLQLSANDIYLLENNVLPIINEENDSMIGPYEDTWIFSQQTKATVLNRLKIYINESRNKKEAEIINEIIRLLEIAIQTHHNIYFHF